MQVTSLARSPIQAKGQYECQEPEQVKLEILNLVKEIKVFDHTSDPAILPDDYRYLEVSEYKSKLSKLEELMSSPNAKKLLSDRQFILEIKPLFDKNTSIFTKCLSHTPLISYFLEEDSPGILQYLSRQKPLEPKTKAADITFYFASYESLKTL